MKKQRMKTNHFPFTTALLAGLQGLDKVARYYDTGCNGLLVEVSPAGKKIFRFFRKVDYKQQWKTIGPFPDISIEEARKQTILFSAELIKGADFTEARQIKKDELTLAELARLYFEQHARNRCETAQDMEKDFYRWFASELEIKLSRIDASLIQNRVNRLGIDGMYGRANKARNLVRAVLNWGFKYNYAPSALGNLRISGFRLPSRERYVRPDEMGKLLDAIHAYSDDRIRDALLICLYTGARVGNVQSMTWDQLDLTLGLWLIERTKTGDSQTIALSDAALAILQKRHAKRGTLKYVFPGGHPTSKTPCFTHLSAMHPAFKRILQAAGLPSEIRIHDLRRSHASYMVLSGASTPLVMKALNHKSLAAAQIYQRLANEPVKIGADKAIELMHQYAKTAK